MAFGIADGSSWFRGPIPTFKDARRVNTVFTELMPLLRQRAVMITISDVGQGLLRVNIIPRKLVVDGSSDENTALTTPLSITGKAEELDRELRDRHFRGLSRHTWRSSGSAAIFRR